MPEITVFTVAQRTGLLFRKLDFLSIFHLILATPQGLIRKELLPAESDGLALLHELVESSLDKEFVDFLFSAIDIEIQDEGSILSKLKHMFFSATVEQKMKLLGQTDNRDLKHAWVQTLSIKEVETILEGKELREDNELFAMCSQLTRKEIIKRRSVDCDEETLQSKITAKTFYGLDALPDRNIDKLITDSEQKLQTSIRVIDDDDEIFVSSATCIEKYPLLCRIRSDKDVIITNLADKNQNKLCLTVHGYEIKALLTYE